MDIEDPSKNVAEYDALLYIENTVPFVAELKITKKKDRNTSKMPVVQAMNRRKSHEFFRPLLEYCHSNKIAYAVIIPSGPVPAEDTIVEEFLQVGGYLMQLYGSYDQISEDVATNIGSRYSK